MPDTPALPFQSLSFSLIEDRRPRSAFKMRFIGEGLYEIHVEKGSAANPSTQFTREVPLEVARRLKDALQQIGVFAWEESYGTGGARRWSLNTVFKEGVFSVSSRGGDVPPEFGAMLEELYKLDFPRPTAGAAGATGQVRGAGSAINAMGLGGLGSMGGMSAGDLGAYSAMGGAAGSGIDFGQLGGFLGDAGLPGFDDEEMARLLAEAQRNPEVFQQRMREEFRHMPREEQDRLLDKLAETGMASRAWWERFFRGGF